jgi:hypothetical protein
MLFTRFVATLTLATLMAGSALAAVPAYDKKEENGTYIFRLRVPAAAMAVAPLKAEIFKRWAKESGEIKSQAISDKKEMPQYFHPYAYDANWRVTFEDARLISVSGDIFIDQGGAHPNAAFDSIVWDKTANRAVPLRALFAKGQADAAYKAIAAAARKVWVSTVSKESGGDPVDPTMANEGISDSAEGLGHYAFTYAKGDSKANGIVLLYGAGEAWAHVMGEFRLAISVQVFRKYLAPEWAGEFK